MLRLRLRDWVEVGLAHAWWQAIMEDAVGSGGLPQERTTGGWSGGTRPPVSAHGPAPSPAQNPLSGHAAAAGLPMNNHRLVRKGQWVLRLRFTWGAHAWIAVLAGSAPAGPGRLLSQQRAGSQQRF